MMMEKEPALAALCGLFDHIANGQSVVVRREGEFFAFEFQRNDEPIV